MTQTQVCVTCKRELPIASFWPISQSDAKTINGNSYATNVYKRYDRCYVCMRDHRPRIRRPHLASYDGPPTRITLSERVRKRYEARAEDAV